MQTLATGKNQKCILKVLRILLSVSQSNFGDLQLDDECIRDIADVITAEADGQGGAQNEQEDSPEQYPRGAIFAETSRDILYDEVETAGVENVREEVKR